jgi:hypothetical protein
VGGGEQRELACMCGEGIELAKHCPVLSWDHSHMRIKSDSGKTYICRGFSRPVSYPHHGPNLQPLPMKFLPLLLEPLISTKSRLTWCFENHASPGTGAGVCTGEKWDSRFAGSQITRGLCFQGLLEAAPFGTLYPSNNPLLLSVPCIQIHQDPEFLRYRR